MENGDLNGIINAYRDKLGDRFPSNFISTSSNKLWLENENATNTLFEDDNLIFTTSEYEYGWVGYHLINGSLYLQSYTIKVINLGQTNFRFPIKWGVYGSNDNNTLELVEKRNEKDLFKNLGQSETFTIKRPRAYNNYYIKLEGPNSQGSKHLRFSQIEFFGAYTKSTDVNLNEIFNKYSTILCRNTRMVHIYIFLCMFISKY